MPDELQWLKTLLPTISELSIFGGSITFSIIPSISDTSLPNGDMSAQNVRFLLALAWLFFLLSLGFSTVGLAVIEFQATALHVGFGGDINGNVRDVKNARWYDTIYWIFCRFYYSLLVQILILLAFLSLAMVVVAYVEPVGWIALAVTALALVLAVGVWFLHVCVWGRRGKAAATDTSTNSAT